MHGPFDTVREPPSDPVPDLVVASVLDEFWPGGGARATPLEGGITNRNFRIDVGAEVFVLRIAGERTSSLGIDRGAEVEAARAAAGIGVGPEVVAAIPERGLLVTRFVAGLPLPAEELEQDVTLAAVVRSVRALHDGPSITATFPVFRVVEEYRAVAASLGVRIPSHYEEAHAFGARIEAALARAPSTPRPCHNDLLNANFLREGEHVWIVDYEYAGMGDPFFDLANLSINNGLSDTAQQLMLRLYLGSVVDADRARLGLLRIMSDFREAMWGVVQQGLSTLDFDYVAYAETHFERLRRSAADPRFEGWLRAASGDT